MARTAYIGTRPTEGAFAPDVARATRPSAVLTGLTGPPSFTRRSLRVPLPAPRRPHVAIWHVGKPDERAHGAYAGVLSRDDWREIDQARHPRLRARAIATRILLRRALTSEVGGAVPAAEWRFERSAFGKPRVADGLPRVHFSVSHTHGASLIALSPNVPLGVDIEGEHDNIDALAAAFLSPREEASFRRIPAAAKVNAFMKIWTVKEAYAKLVGIGLAVDSPCPDLDVERAEFLRGSEAAEDGFGTQLKTWTIDCAGRRHFIALAIGQSPAPDPHCERIGIRWRSV